jgi:hypothetical protein
MKNVLKMAFFDQNYSRIKVNFGHFYTPKNRYFFRPIGEKIAKSGHPVYRVVLDTIEILLTPTDKVTRLGVYFPIG